MWARGRALFSRTRVATTITAATPPHPLAAAAAAAAAARRKASTSSASRLSATAAAMAATTTTTSPSSSSPKSLPTHPASTPGIEVLSGPPLTVLRVPVLSDNYVWIVRSHSGGPDGKGLVAVVDPAEAAPVASALADAARRIDGWPASGRLDYILNTHHHFDHVGGNLELKKQFPGCKVVGPKADADRIPGIDVRVGDGDNGGFSLGGPGLELVAIDTPGHTKGHVCLWFPGAKCLFTGDTVFAMGCGRLFEGDAETMWRSLRKLRDAPHAVPPETVVFCAHEYTQSNARFAAEVAEPGNAALRARKAAVDAARARGDGTVPFLWGEELGTNPFLRADKAGVAAGFGGGDGVAAAHEVFKRVRAAKDSFR